MLFVAVGPHASLWWDGKLADDYTLWGIPVVWVARAGKVIQVGAGLVAVFDLLTAEWSTAWARRASVGAAQREVLARHWNRLEMIARDLRQQDFRGSPFMDQGLTPVGFFLLSSPPRRVPRNVRLSLPAYRDFHRRVVEQVEHEHLCEKPHKLLCDEQSAFLIRNVDRLAMGQLSRVERAIVTSADARRVVGTSDTIIAVLTLLAGGSFVSAGLVGAFHQVAGMLLLVLALALAAIVGILVGVSGNGWLPVQTMWYRAQKRLANFLEDQSKKSPPFVAVKVAALCMFLFGAALDLLAS
ncbi:hypothetical protein C8054_06230 [Micromonospora sp. RP3T]|nr:hypothetical protein C8054_06230 [Micromonospora sp. RP3T]